MSQIRQITEIGILTAMITILGAIKIPNLVPGIEFQLSAPFAVAICAAFGFKKYIISGCLSSLIGLALGTQNFLSVAIAMQFRLVVGFLLWICKNHMLGVILSGPIGFYRSSINIICLRWKRCFSYGYARSTWYDFYCNCGSYNDSCI